MLTFTDRETEASEGVVGDECREGQSPGPLASLLPCGGMACVLCHKIAPPLVGVFTDGHWMDDFKQFLSFFPLKRHMLTPKHKMEEDFRSPGGWSFC